MWAWNTPAALAYRNQLDGSQFAPFTNDILAVEGRQGFRSCLEWFPITHEWRRCRRAPDSARSCYLSPDRVRSQAYPHRDGAALYNNPESGANRRSIPESTAPASGRALVNRQVWQKASTVPFRHPFDVLQLSLTRIANYRAASRRRGFPRRVAPTLRVLLVPIAKTGIASATCLGTRRRIQGCVRRHRLLGRDNG